MFETTIKESVYAHEVCFCISGFQFDVASPLFSSWQWQRLEYCLSNVQQSPSKLMQDALSSLLKALVTEKLLRHPEVDVRVAVASCIRQMIRISAPDPPCDDEQMEVLIIYCSRFNLWVVNFIIALPFFFFFFWVWFLYMQEVFALIVSSFENLSDNSSQSYIKRTSILVTMADLRTCVLMLDYELHGLIEEMFQRFLEAIRYRIFPVNIDCWIINLINWNYFCYTDLYTKLVRKNKI